MSIQYKIAEAKLNGSVKKELYESLEQPQNRNDVPDFIQNKFDVEKLEFGEHCMFKIAPRDVSCKTAGVHHEIVQRAVELCTAVYNPSALGNLVGVGNVSATNIGVVPSNNKERD